MLDTLTRLTALYPAQARPLGPPMPLGNAGGLSGARLWRFDSGSGPTVARAWPLDGPRPDALRGIHAWLARLADLEFIPVPLAALDGRTLIELDDVSWEVTPWRPGAADASRPPAPMRLRAAFSALAAVHQRLAFESTRAPSPGVTARLAVAS
jgi:Ser/Thr protein kinase RdoA (MazF antagonist)